LAIQEIGKFDCLVNGIPSSEYPTPAKRPPFLYWIKVNKNIFGVEVPAYKSEFKQMYGVALKLEVRSSSEYIIYSS
jgi:dTDP-4-dehydrorhamnose reductase